MNRLMTFLYGSVLIEITGAWPQRAVNALAAARIPMGDFSMQDALCCRIRILQRDLPRARQLIERAQCESRVCARGGIHARFYGLKYRKFLIGFFLLIMMLVLLLPQFVWTISVEGNETVPDGKILQALELLGIGFGTYGPSIDSQTVKNQMLALVPELEWLAVNRSGGRAVVSVREKRQPPALIDTQKIVNIVAARTGIITKAEVYSGKSLVEPGQTVLQGELLVSGLVQWTNRVQTSHAMAEIYARTWHSQTAVMPQHVTVRESTGEEQVIKTLIFGKKRIKLSGKSSISEKNCVKIKTESVLTLPGGISLPIRLETMRCRTYLPQIQVMPPVDAFSILAAGTKSEIQADLLAGEILQTRCTQRAENGRYDYSTVAECSEQIASEVSVETDEGES